MYYLGELALRSSSNEDNDDANELRQRVEAIAQDIAHQFAPDQPGAWLPIAGKIMPLLGMSCYTVGDPEVSKDGLETAWAKHLRLLAQDETLNAQRNARRPS
jgi:hypothetical protein